MDGAADGAQLKIEDDMLDAELRPDRTHYASVGEQLSHIRDDVWDRPSMFTALRIRRTYDDSSVMTSQQRVVGTNTLPDPGDFARAVNIERDAKAAIDQSAAMSMHRAYGPVAALSAEERASLAEQLREIREKRKRLDRLGYYWLHGPVTEAL